MAAKGPKLKTTPFDPSGDRLHVGKAWPRLLERFERELEYNGVDSADKDNSHMCMMALLIHAGPEVEDIYESLAEITRPNNIAAEDWTE